MNEAIHEGPTCHITQTTFINHLELLMGVIYSIFESGGGVCLYGVCFDEATLKKTPIRSSLCAQFLRIEVCYLWSSLAVRSSLGSASNKLKLQPSGDKFAGAGLVDDSPACPAVRCTQRLSIRSRISFEG